MHMHVCEHMCVLECAHVFVTRLPSWPVVLRLESLLGPWRCLVRLEEIAPTLLTWLLPQITQVNCWQHLTSRVLYAGL